MTSLCPTQTSQNPVPSAHRRPRAGVSAESQVGKGSPRTQCDREKGCQAETHLLSEGPGPDTDAQPEESRRERPQPPGLAQVGERERTLGGAPKTDRPQPDTRRSSLNPLKINSLKTRFSEGQALAQLPSSSRGLSHPVCKMGPGGHDRLSPFKGKA